MRIIPRNALRTLTGAAILGFGALAFSAGTADAHGFWGHRHHHHPHHHHHHHRHHGWHGGYVPYQAYVAPRPLYRPYYVAPAPRVVVMPQPYYAPRPYYRSW